jgi:hypothetical protein
MKHGGEELLFHRSSKSRMRSGAWASLTVVRANLRRTLI